MKTPEPRLATTKPAADFWRTTWISGAAMFLLALAFAGCISRPALNDETFDFSSPPASTTNGAVRNAVLEITSLKVAAPFDGRAMVYRTGEYSYERDPYAQFLGLPAEDMAAPLRSILRGTGCFSDVVESGGGLKPDILARITVSELYGDVRKPKNPEAVLAMHLTFLDMTNGMPGKVAFRGRYTRRIPMHSTSPASLMEGWNRALNEILQEAASDFQRGQDEQ